MSVRPLFRFHGGIHPPEHKVESNGSPIVAATLPSRLVISLHQSVGNRSKPIVQPGDHVKKGQLIATADGVVSAALHAPTSGLVVAVGPAAVIHPSGLADLCVTLQPDGQDEWLPRSIFNWREAAPLAVREYLRDMGIVGLGGAIFPSHLKLNAKRALDTLVVNGAECEPYLTCDDRLMRERAAGIVEGIKIVRGLLQAKEALIGIEDNKPEAIAAMQAATQDVDGVSVVVVPTLYPSGGAKQLIKLLTNKEVPSGIRSTELGVQCFNVGTLYSIWRALEFAEPVLSRIVTLTGHVARPGNYDVLLGTSVTDMLALAGDLPGSSGYIYGGPMMGFEIPDLSGGLTKSGNCIIAKHEDAFAAPALEMPCIRCGKCAEACPAELQPMDLYWFARGRLFEKSQKWNLFDCIECGACAYVCPSSIRLVDYFRFSKSEIWDQEKKQQDADRARQRHEFRLFRVERDKAEKAARLAAKAAEKPVAVAGAEVPAADAERAAKIKAAMERAAAKKAEAAALPSETTSAQTVMAPSAVPVAATSALDPEKAARIKAAMEKRAAEKAAEAAMSPEEKAAKEAEKQARIQAAKEKAVAKKVAAGSAPAAE